MESWLDRLRRELEAATSGLTEPEWKNAPNGHWNIAQILEHLGRTYGGTAKMLEQTLIANERSAPQLRSATVKERAVQMLLLGSGRFPPGQKAPEFLIPRADAGAEMLPKTFSGLERMRRALDAAESRWGGDVAVAIHFTLGPMSARQWSKFHYLHGRHHIEQIQQRRAASAG